MKKTLLLILSLFLLLGCTQENVENKKTEDMQISEEQVSKEEKENKKETEVEDKKLIEVELIEVVDGDTMKILLNGKEETIRLLLVDTPEVKHPRLGEQPFGKEASSFANETLKDGIFYIEVDVSERDKYGRLLCYLYKNDEMFNELLLENGLARVAYVYPPNTKYVDRFREIQEIARKKEIGIWSIENYATDKGFNKEVIEEKELKRIENDKLSQDCVNPYVKGNINSKGEKIYHIPSGQYYDITNPEELFCSEEAAKEAGYRKSQR